MLAALIPFALAYGEQVHATITLEALKPMGFDQPVVLDLEQLARVRTAIDTRGRTNPDPAIKDAWIKRYPTPESFDAWALKEFLMLAPGSTVFNIDQIDGKPSQLELISLGARQPDDDKRNYDRLAYDASRQPIKDSQGKPVPADPALLNMGKLGALSSQAHAHYGLAQVEFSDDSEVLKTDPKRFAVAAGYEDAPIMTLAAEMNQIHLDLALIAGANSHDSLAWAYAGNSYHYLEDVGNQIHTVQVGLFDFFMDAFKDRMWMSVKSCGGYCGELRTLASIGIDILTNHHTISEYLTEKRLMEAFEGKDSPEGKRLLTAISAGDPEFEKTLDAALAALGPNPENGEFGIAITRALIAVSAEEGDDVYRATRAIALPKWRKEGVLYDYASADPDQAVYPNEGKYTEAYNDFWALQEKAFRRVGVAVRKEAELQRTWLKNATPTPLPPVDPAATPTDPTAPQTPVIVSTPANPAQEAVIDRLIRRQLEMLDTAEKRRTQYLANPPVSSVKPEKMPAMAAAEVGAVGTIGLVVWRRRSRMG